MRKPITLHGTLLGSLSLVALLGFLFLTALDSAAAPNPRTTHHPEMTTAAFAERWSWAEQRLKTERRGGWIGYAVDFWMEPDSYLFASGGVWIRDGRRVSRRSQLLRDQLGVDLATLRPPEAINSAQPGEERRTIAVLIRIDGQQRLIDVDMVDLELAADLEGQPLTWIGVASTEESLRVITNLWPSGSKQEGLRSRAEQLESKEDVIEAVGFHDRPEAVDFLDRILNSQEHDSLRAEAAESLADQTADRALQLLISTARDDRSEHVRQEAVETLGEIRVDGAEEALVELARYGQGRHLRAEAVETLGDLATPSALAALRDILWHDDDTHVQQEALETLADHHHDEIDDSTLDFLIHVARDHPKSSVRQEAVEALADLAADKVVGELEDLATHDTDFGVREEALDALAELAGGVGIPALVKVARTHPELRLREEALDALADAGEDHPRARRALEMMASE